MCNTSVLAAEVLSVGTLLRSLQNAPVELSPAFTEDCYNGQFADDFAEKTTVCYLAGRKIRDDETVPSPKLRFT